MSIIDVIRGMFSLGRDNRFSYHDADPHLEPDSDDSRGYKKNQFQARQFSYLYEIGDEFDTSRDEAQPVEIEYYGLLKNCGADAVYLHYGFDNWDDRSIHTVMMNHHPGGGFHLTISPDRHRELNYCFKDSADHWDNNDGRNWIIRIGRIH